MVESKPYLISTESRMNRHLIHNEIRTLATFLPDILLTIPIEHLFDRNELVGVLLFADVSGFTPLSEKYNKLGKDGMYRLTATLNAYIGSILEVIHSYGGDVLKFSGDAFLALFRLRKDVFARDLIHRVIVCALFIQHNLGEFQTEVGVMLRIKLAISYGSLTFKVIGDAQCRHYMIFGDQINDVKAAEHVSVSGDVVVSPYAWSNVFDGHYEYTLADDGTNHGDDYGGNIKVWNCHYQFQADGVKEMYDQLAQNAFVNCSKHLTYRDALGTKRNASDRLTDKDITERFMRSLPKREATIQAVDTWNLSVLKSFIVGPVQHQVEERQPIKYMTEMRNMVILFINIIPLGYNTSKLCLMIDEAYLNVCRIVIPLNGIVNKVSMFDKDAMILVLFGLRGGHHELDSKHALQCAFSVRQILTASTISSTTNINSNSNKLKYYLKSVSIGVTSGLVYCGVVGHQYRREFTVIGNAVNKAARIMCAFESKVTCDSDTMIKSQLPYERNFVLMPKLKLKGIEDAGLIYEFINCPSKSNESIQSILLMERSDTGRLANVTLNLYDSLSLYEQLIVKFAAVIDAHAFNRDLLIYLLQRPNPVRFNAAIKSLIDKQVFDYGYDHADDDVDEVDIMMIHFKNANIQSIAYNILDPDQRRQLHLDIITFIEEKNDLCPNCTLDPTNAIIKLHSFRKFISLFHDESLKKKIQSSSSAVNILEWTVKEMIRQDIIIPINDSQLSSNDRILPMRGEYWDSTKCTCLKLMIDDLRSLTRHSISADHISKQIFYETQLCATLIAINRIPESLPLLEGIGQLCETDYEERLIVPRDFKKVMIAKVNMLLAEAYYRLGDNHIARRHLQISLQRYNMSLKRISISSWWTKHLTINYSNDYNQLDLALIVALVAKIHKSEGDLTLAYSACKLSVSRLIHFNSDLEILFDLYSSDITHSYCCIDEGCGGSGGGENNRFFCEKVGCNISKVLLAKYTTDGSFIELQMLSDLLITMFELKVCNGNYLQAIKLGYRAIELNTIIEANLLQIKLIPEMATILIRLNRIDEAVCLARKLKRIALVAYYGFCIELILETNFWLEPLELIERYAFDNIDKNIDNDDREEGMVVVDNKLIIYLTCYSLRNPSRVMYDWTQCDFNYWRTNLNANKTVKNLLNSIKYMEYLLMTYALEKTAKIVDCDLDRPAIVSFLERCKRLSDECAMLKPRYLLYKAYFKLIENDNTKSIKKDLKKAIKIAIQQNNVLDEIWTRKHLTCWFNESDDSIEPIEWMLSETNYRTEEWSQMLYSLPVRFSNANKINGGRTKNARHFVWR